MSVINKMLSDLEERQHTATTADYIETSSSSFFLHPFAIVALIVVTSLVTYGVTQSEYITLIESPAANDSKAIQNAIEAEQSAKDGQPFTADQTPEFDQSPVQIRTEQTRSKPPVQDNNDETKLAVATQSDDAASFTITRSEIEDSENENRVASTRQSFQVSSSKGDSRQIASLREGARIALDEGRTSRAISLLTQILEIAPEHTSTRKQLASLLYAKQDTALAIATLENGIAEAPNDSSIRLMLARIAYRQGDTQQAQETLKQHPSTSFASTELLSFRAALSEQMGDYQQAHQDYKLLITREPNTAKWWLGLAVSQDKLRLPGEAIVSYRRVQKLNQLSMQVQDFVKTRIDSLTGQS
ncbi:MAG: tetratricopeptide repeat protein [Pseudomonadota bacterium]